MAPPYAPARGRIDGLALLLASVTAPAASFVLWSVWTSVTESLGPPEFSMLLYWLILVVLFAAWGAPSAAAFGAAALWLLQRQFGQTPLWALVVAGMAAAGLYTGGSAGLALAGQQWIFLASPWAKMLLDPAQHQPHEAPVIVAIVLSGAVGGLTYWSVERRRQA